MVGEALAAEVRLGELQALDHRAHGAVEHEDAGGERGVDGRGVGGTNVGSHQVSCSPAYAASCPRRAARRTGRLDCARRRARGHR